MREMPELKWVVSAGFTLVCKEPEEARATVDNIRDKAISAIGNSAPDLSKLNHGLLSAA